MSHQNCDSNPKKSLSNEDFQEFLQNVSDYVTIKMTSEKQIIDFLSLLNLNINGFPMINEIKELNNKLLQSKYFIFFLILFIIYHFKVLQKKKKNGH